MLILRERIVGWDEALITVVPVWDYCDGEYLYGERGVDHCDCHVFDSSRLGLPSSGYNASKVEVEGEAAPTYPDLG
jgi:hypothetical protein